MPVDGIGRRHGQLHYLKIVAITLELLQQIDVGFKAGVVWVVRIGLHRRHQRLLIGKPHEVVDMPIRIVTHQFTAKPEDFIYVQHLPQNPLDV